MGSADVTSCPSGVHLRSCLVQFKALVEGGSSPVQVLKDIYIGTVPMSRKEMRSCIAGMFNQPYAESTEELSKAQSQVSLTQIIALASSEDHTANPTAPTLATLERGGCAIDPNPSPQQPSRPDSGEHRPPPFAPGHATALDAPEGALGMDQSPSPSAPGMSTMMRPWPESPLCESSEMLPSHNYTWNPIISPLSCSLMVRHFPLTLSQSV